MDPIRLFLCLALALFPRILDYVAVSAVPVSIQGNRRKRSVYVIGHRLLGWYRIILETMPSGWMPLRVVDVVRWSRLSARDGSLLRALSRHRARADREHLRTGAYSRNRNSAR